MLHRLVQRRVEVLALDSEGGQAESGEHPHELVGHRLQRSVVEVAVAASPVEIVEHRKQLTDHRGLGAFAGRFLITQRTLAVVGEVGLHALQIGGEFGDLVRRRLRSRPTRGRAGSHTFANLAGLRVDPTLVGHRHRFIEVVAHLFS